MKQLNWYQIFGKSNIPDGRTVLPTDDIQIWLHCANIWNKTYTTLAEVLADTDTLLALINSNNAVDYMVRSTSFIYGVGTVPAMTSATTPSGTVGGSISSTGHEAYKAFDGDDTTYALRSASSSGGVDYTSSEAKNVKAMYVFNASSTALNFTIYYKETAESANATASSAVSIPSNSGKYINTTLDNYSGILWGAFAQTISGTTDLKISTVQFYDFGVVLSSTAMSYIGLNNYCANTLLADSTWLNAICNSTYFESVLNVKVPTMTSNNTPSGLCFVWQQYENQAYYVFDGNDTTYSRCVLATSGSGFGYQFTSAKKILISKGRACHNSATGYIRTEKIQYSDDGVTWSDSDTFTVNENNGTKIEGDSMWYIPYSQMVSETSAHAYWRVFLTGATNNTRNGFFTINFYGREDV